jgi:hypothetical protein
MLTKKDLDQLKASGIAKEQIEFQVECFRKGFPFARLKAPATKESGILSFSLKEHNELIDVFITKSRNYRTLKFIPASGAATRMFHHLFEFKEKFNKKLSDEELFQQRDFNSAWYFFEHLDKFAFYYELKKVMAKAGHDLESCRKDREYGIILDYFLFENGLNYGQMPKGVIKFHDYGIFKRTALGEHLVEAAHYCMTRERTVPIHFTVSQEHMEKFNNLISLVRPYYENMFDIKYEIQFSAQKPSTDTIAVDMNNEPFREADGSLVFRPGGHGALIENLNDLEADIVFIKNIDNIVPDRLKSETYKYKKVLGGLLIKLQEQIFAYLRKMDIKPVEDSLIKEISQFCVDSLDLKLPERFNSMEHKQQYQILQGLLNRPIRICGMVRNQGEPGGGPFFTENSHGLVSLQIVESSQINMKDPGQVSILKSATHFNPVDLVCGIKDYKGRKFDLHKFIDPETGFISIKSKDGRQLKALELPGLWNGAMANWMTLFVEVPLATFNPVKTVNDLLREQHQNN